MDTKEEQHLIHIASLIARNMHNDLSPAEENELAHWLSGTSINQQVYSQLLSEPMSRKAYRRMSAFDSKNAYRRVKKRVSFSSSHTISIKRKIGYYVAAASLILIASLTAYLFTIQRQATTSTIAVVDSAETGQRATVVLADGRTFFLDGRGKKLRMTPGALRDATGKLIAETEAVVSAKITTPKGATYEVQLPDGTLVKLNAASSLVYPTEFLDNRRDVTLVGEGYFEVVKKKGSPFFVHTAQQRVSVLGTHFNIAAYAESNVTKTTLLEGAVAVESTNGEAKVRLGPGEQSVLNSDRIITKSHIDVQQEVAWLYGRFNFEGKHLKEVMDELSRWYNVEVRYEGDIPDVEFFGGTFKTSKLTTILKLLESHDISYSFEGDNVLVIRQKSMRKGGLPTKT